MWTFVERDGTEYFLKQFLSPTYPTEDGPGSITTKDRKRNECEQFEAHQQQLRNALREMVADGGNLVATREFFRHGAKYYKVTEKVDTSGVDPEFIPRLALESKLLVLKMVAHSLRILHRNRIVHGDLKPANILVKRTPSGGYAAKLIDFDNSYFSGEPPENAETLVGDSVYYSPELARYVASHPLSSPSDLTQKSDIFALGVVFSKYLTGKLPPFNPKFQYCWQAVESGDRIVFKDPTLPGQINDLVTSMLQLSPLDRPTIEDVYGQLPVGGRIRAIAPSPIPRDAQPLRGSLIRTDPREALSPSKDEAPPAPAPADVRLKGTLLRKKEG